jgi:hypothetical protein
MLAEGRQRGPRLPIPTAEPDTADTGLLTYAADLLISVSSALPHRRPLRRIQLFVTQQ